MKVLLALQVIATAAPTKQREQTGSCTGKCAQQVQMLWLLLAITWTTPTCLCPCQTTSSEQPIPSSAGLWLISSCSHIRLFRRKNMPPEETAVAQAILELLVLRYGEMMRQAGVVTLVYMWVLVLHLFACWPGFHLAEQPILWMALTTPPPLGTMGPAGWHSRPASTAAHETTTRCIFTASTPTWLCPSYMSEGPCWVRRWWRWYIPSISSPTTCVVPVSGLFTSCPMSSDISTQCI